MSAPEAEFVEIFRDEARERLDAIVTTLLALEAGGAPADAIDSLFRDTHTIKGAAGMVGLSDVSDLAHAMEDVLATARATGVVPPELIDPLLRGADSLRRHVEGVGEPVAGLVAELSNDTAQPVVAVLEVPVTDTADFRAPENGTPEIRTTETATAEPETRNGSHATELPAATPARKQRRAIRVAPEKIDTLLDLVGETVLHRRRLEHVIDRDVAGAQQSITDELDAGGHLLDGLKDAAIGMRTLPLQSIVGSLPRVVRDLAIETGKEADLVGVSGDALRNVAATDPAK